MLSSDSFDNFIIISTLLLFLGVFIYILTSSRYLEIKKTKTPWYHRPEYVSQKYAKNRALGVLLDKPLF